MYVTHPSNGPAARKKNTKGEKSRKTSSAVQVLYLRFVQYTSGSVSYTSYEYTFHAWIEPQRHDTSISTCHTYCSCQVSKLGYDTRHALYSIHGRKTNVVTSPRRVQEKKKNISGKVELLLHGGVPDNTHDGAMPPLPKLRL